MSLAARWALGAWLAGVAGCVAVIARTEFSTDLSAFLPRSPSPVQQVLVEQPGEWTALAFSPDARTLIVEKSISINESELYLVDVASKAMTRGSPKHRAGAWRPSVVVDGRVT